MSNHLIKQLDREVDSLRSNIGFQVSVRNKIVDWLEGEIEHTEPVINGDEVLTDGATGQAFENPIFTGTQYFMKLRHIVKKKQGVHSYGSYDIDEQPVGKGAQKTGVLDTYSYLAHGAKKNLYEMTAIKGRNNEEY